MGASATVILLYVYLEANDQFSGTYADADTGSSYCSVENTHYICEQRVLQDKY